MVSSAGPLTYLWNKDVFPQAESPVEEDLQKKAKEREFFLPIKMEEQSQKLHMYLDCSYFKCQTAQGRLHIKRMGCLLEIFTRTP